MLTNKDIVPVSEFQHLLVKAAGEASELAHAILKGLEFGIDHTYPNSDVTILDKINLEYNDLLGVIEKLVRIGFPITVHPDLIEKKTIKIDKFMDVARAQGALRPKEEETYPPLPEGIFKEDGTYNYFEQQQKLREMVKDAQKTMQNATDVELYISSPRYVVHCNFCSRNHTLSECDCKWFAIYDNIEKQEISHWWLMDNADNVAKHLSDEHRLTVTVELQQLQLHSPDRTETMVESLGNPSTEEPRYSIQPIPRTCKHGAICDCKKYAVYDSVEKVDTSKWIKYENASVALDKLNEEDRLVKSVNHQRLHIPLPNKVYAKELVAEEKGSLNINFKDLLPGEKQLVWKVSVDGNPGNLAVVTGEKEIEDFTTHLKLFTDQVLGHEIILFGGEYHFQYPPFNFVVSATSLFGSTSYTLTVKGNGTGTEFKVFSGIDKRRLKQEIDSLCLLVQVGNTTPNDSGVVSKQVGGEDKEPLPTETLRQVVNEHFGLRPTPRYVVKDNPCNCHPETCNCDDYAIFDTKIGEKHSTHFSDEVAEEIASALNGCPPVSD